MERLIIAAAFLIPAGILLAWSLCRTARYIPVVREDTGEYDE